MGKGGSGGALNGSLHLRSGVVKPLVMPVYKGGRVVTVDEEMPAQVRNCQHYLPRPAESYSRSAGASERQHSLSLSAGPSATT
jgi:hypothetical protein